VICLTRSYDNVFLTRLAIGITCLILFACTPVNEDHYFISLEKNNGIEIIKKGELPEVFFNESVPLKYRLEKQDYVLFFEIQSAGNAEIEIKVVNKLDNERTLSVNSVSVDGNEIDGLSTEDNCLYLFVNKTINEKLASVLPVESKINITRILEAKVGIAILSVRSICLIGDMSNVIVLNIVDANDKAVGSVEMQFDFIKNGKHLYFDAI